jgi:glucose/mannose-6-phosphate isomerase
MSDMRAAVAELPAQLRWAAQVQVPELPAAERAVVSGMGGSAIAGDIAAVVAAQSGRRVDVHRSYGMPSWAAASGALAVFVSHSGNTEETLSSFDAAAASGLHRVVVATGGRLAELAEAEGCALVQPPAAPQPRAAVGSLAGAVVRVLESAGIVPPMAEELEEAAAVVEELLGGGSGPSVALAADLAEALEGRIAVVCGGAGVSAVAARRWKTQIHENGKSMAFWSQLPELDHNEVEGWASRPVLARDRIGLVFLHDPADHAGITRRVRVTREILEDRVGIAGEVHAQGNGVLARLFSLIVVGDLVSVAVAERAGIDPMPVTIIDELKARLAQEES